MSWCQRSRHTVWATPQNQGKRSLWVSVCGQLSEGERSPKSLVLVLVNHHMSEEWRIRQYADGVGLRGRVAKKPNYATMGLWNPLTP